MATHELAQLNIAIMRAPLDSPAMHGFTSNLDRINAVAEATPGFVWRLKTDDGDATAIRPYDDPNVLVNLSVWTGMDALQEYVYRSDHAGIMRQRREWFERVPEATMVLWWVPAGHRPDITEAVTRLEVLRRDGPTAAAFTFWQPFPAP